MDIRSAFELTGMTSSATGHAKLTLALALATPERLTQQWTTTGEPVAWRGQLGDGRELTIERGLHGELLFTYERTARYLLSGDEHTLICAPERSGHDWQRTLLGKVLPFVSIWRGHEALHASAVESPHGVVAVLAPSGMGKTTLALALIERGWPLFSDDVLVLANDGECVLAHPGTPHMNVEATDGPQSGRLGRTLDDFATERWIAAHTTATVPRPVALLCALERRPSFALAAETVRPSPLPLAPYVLGLPGDPQRERRRFVLYADLMDGSRLVRLTCGADDTPSDVAQLVERIVLEQGPVATPREAASRPRGSTRMAVGGVA
ncbi:MAG TPA: hypothetical protein VGF47_06400 [Solirubrobacteraceae bacterium]